MAVHRRHRSCGSPITERAANLAGYNLKLLKIPFTPPHNALFALELDGLEAIILEVRGSELPEWVFAYAYGRLVPTLKLVRVLEGELPSEIPLPTLVNGLRMDEDEPGVESVTYWREPEDLLWQLQRAFFKLDEKQTVFRTPSKVPFISTASAAARRGFSSATPERQTRWPAYCPKACGCATSNSSNTRIRAQSRPEAIGK